MKPDSLNPKPRFLGERTHLAQLGSVFSFSALVSPALAGATGVASGRLPGGGESWEVGPHELDKCSQKHRALYQSWRSRLRLGIALPSTGGGDTEV